MPDNEEPHTIPTSPSSERARSFFARNSTSNAANAVEAEEVEFEEKGRPTKWSMGVLNDPNTHEVPGMLAGFGKQ
jgi:hypothetical protein